MKILGREPVAWLTLLKATIMLALVLGIIHVSTEQVGQIMAVAAAAIGVLTAYLTHNVALGVITGLVEAVVALAVGFGAHITPDQLAIFLLFVTALFGFFQRTQTGPADVVGFHEEYPQAA